MPLPNQGGGGPQKTRLKGKGGKVQLTVPHPKLMSLSRATLKANPCPNGSGLMPGHYF
jgi:hypothetical protein